MMAEGPSGYALDAAHSIIAAHANGDDCRACRPGRPGWCPSKEWALWVVVDDGVPKAARQMVTVVARQILTAHWPRGVDGCLPCGSPDCAQMKVAATWLEVIRDDYIPPQVKALLPSNKPTADDLRRITGMD